MPVRLNLKGKKFGRLIVLRWLGDSVWLCSCSCGGTARVKTGKLTTGYTSSCGCLRYISGKKNVNFVHGHASVNNGPTVEYKSWQDMKRRCLAPNSSKYADYGGRGIKVCERWLNSFQSFLSDMGLKPNRSYTIERNDNDGNYEPANCRWATRSEQMANRRPYTNATRKKISESRKGQKPSLESRIKMSVARKGKLFTEEHKHRISEGKKNFYARMRTTSNL